MKYLFLLTWVGQFGFSFAFPPCFFLLLAIWLQHSHGWSALTVWIGGALGFLIAIRTVPSNWRAMKNVIAEISSGNPTPVSFNDHK